MSEREGEGFDLFKVVRKRRLLIGVGTGICLLAGLLYSFSSPKIYKAVLYLQVGKVWGKPIENSFRTAEIIKSEGFLKKVQEKGQFNMTAYDIQRRGFVKAEALEGGKAADSIPFLLEVETRFLTSNGAVKLGNVISELLVKEHEVFFNELMAEHNQYQKDLEHRLVLIQEGIRDLEEMIKRQSEKPQVNAPAIILLEAQMEEKNNLFLVFLKELHQVKVNNISKTLSVNTRVVSPPVLREDPSSPSTAVTMVIFGLGGLLLCVLFAFFVELIVLSDILGTKREGGRSKH